MKKFIFSLLTAIMVVCTCHAQTSLVATLNHEGNITAYYGINALSSAHDAAANGDVITLSSGTFNSCLITKAVTIRGAGMEYSDGMEPTILQNNFDVSVETDESNVFTMEGIFHNANMSLRKANKPLFFKCRFGGVSFTYSGSVRDASFIHCKVATSFYLHNGCNVAFDNCVVCNPVMYNASGMSTSTNYRFTNCVLRFYGGSYGSHGYTFKACPSNICYSYLKNCIIYSTLTESSYNTFSSISLFYNVANVDCFANALNTTNKVEADFTKLFKTWTGGDYSDMEKFDLTDSAATTYVGDDGKQVGIYGGSLPYDPVPTHPRITKCDVASKTTADGKLSVDIEVKGADY